MRKGSKTLRSVVATKNASKGITKEAANAALLKASKDTGKKTYNHSTCGR